MDFQTAAFKLCLATIISYVFSLPLSLNLLASLPRAWYAGRFGLEPAGVAAAGDVVITRSSVRTCPDWRCCILEGAGRRPMLPLAGTQEDLSLSAAWTENQQLQLMSS